MTAQTILAVILALILGMIIGAFLMWRYRPQSEQPQPAAELVQVENALTKLDHTLAELEKERVGAYSSLASHMQAMTRTSLKLTDRTDKLVNALHSPQVRGRWGEIQLERVVELGGMVKHCDFDSQVTAYIGDEMVRPDLVINLSGGRQIVVDAKVPFSAYLDAMDSHELDPEEQAAYLRRHAHLVRNHVNLLSAKRYMDAFDPTPEFVVCFVPADPFLDAALQVDPELLEHAFNRNIVLATPTTLFALLRTVALGWRQEDISHKTKDIQRQGRMLLQRLKTFLDHYSKIGRNLEKTVEAYNSTLGSLESRVIVTARRLAEHEGHNPESITKPETIDIRLRDNPEY